MEVSQPLVLAARAVHWAQAGSSPAVPAGWGVQEEADVEPVGHAVISVHCSSVIHTTIYGSSREKPSGFLLKIIPAQCVQLKTHFSSLKASGAPVHVQALGMLCFRHPEQFDGFSRACMKHVCFRKWEEYHKNSLCRRMRSAKKGCVVGRGKPPDFRG